VIDMPARPDRSNPAFPAPAGPRLPARLRSRRTLVVPPARRGSLCGGAA
jgi:hypothetical protein